MSLEFLAMSLVVVLMPGTGVIYTVAVGLGRGFSASVVAAFGCTLGIVPQMLASLVGLAAVLHTSAVAFQVLKFAGALYLLYMAWGVLRSGDMLRVERRETVSAARTIRDAILLNVLNPKLSIFFLAFLPQFVPADSTNPTLAMVPLALTFMAMTFVVFVLYGALAAAARTAVLERPGVMKWLRRVFAGTFAALGLQLALAQR
ncbi:LysE family translocator [Acuticoccus sediminis]|uniref:LysE family translocator n=1 Tax=Acuticoccus sediminis TaxID=2184697 RepID=UPI001CFF16F2|nr:LysE family translocator [Acuticoccus sediminis]